MRQSLKMQQNKTNPNPQTEVPWQCATTTTTQRAPQTANATTAQPISASDHATLCGHVRTPTADGAPRDGVEMK